jgi:membrane protein DedA with SNARE-associated domain
MLLELFRFIKAPLVFLLFFTLLHAASITGVLPSINDLGALVKTFFDDYGLVAIGVLSFIENIIGVNAYFPGSIVILTGMSLTAGQPLRGIMTFGVITLFAFLAYNINYFIGRLFKKNTLLEGRHTNSSKTNIELWVWYFGSFWHPHFAALTCVITGSEGFSYRWFAFRLLVVGIFWNAFWAITMYNIGVLGTDNIDLTLVMYLYLSGWITIDTVRYFKSQNHQVMSKNNANK